MTDQPPAQLTGEQKAAFGNARRPALRLTDKDKVRELLGPIGEKLNAGWSYEEVRQELAKTVGFKGSRRTLYNYVWQLSLNQGEPATPAPPVPGVSEPNPHPSPPASSQPAGESKPNSGRHYIQSLGGEYARAARQRAKEAQAKSKPKSLVDRLNEPL